MPNTNAKLDELKAKLRRRAIVFEIGGFRPSGDPFESAFGRVTMCAPGQTWPESNGKVLQALCQINLTNLPFRPLRLDDMEFISVFVALDDLPNDTPNGEGWCLRTYKSVNGLVPMAQPTTGGRIKPFPMRATVVDEDFPCWDDIPTQLPRDIEDRYYDLFKNEPGLKLGGWPSLVQAEIFWAPYNRHPAAPEYVLQIDSCEKANWMWGDAGVGYFGRGTAVGKEDERTLSWQCY